MQQRGACVVQFGVCAEALADRWVEKLNSAPHRLLASECGAADARPQTLLGRPEGRVGLPRAWRAGARLAVAVLVPSPPHRVPSAKRPARTFTARVPQTATVWKDFTQPDTLAVTSSRIALPACESAVRMTTRRLARLGRLRSLRGVGAQVQLRLRPRIVS